MVYAFGVGDAPISVSGTDGDAVLHTVRAVGAVTRAICAAEPGDVLGIRGPFGTTWPVDAAAGHDVVLVAGGIGLPPLRPVLRALLADRGRGPVGHPPLRRAHPRASWSSATSWPHGPGATTSASG